MGVVILGDSASAHFSIPPALFNATQVFNDSNWDDILHTLLNEADWPQCSWSTAYETAGNCPVNYVEGGIQSIYTRMRDRNRCNHRDYQNMGVNGGRTGNMAPPTGDIVAMQRNQTTDAPALVFYAPIGNDVCSGHPGFDHMTTPEDFKANVLTALDWLDQTLPAGSHVVFIPLADGLLLYDILRTRTHPIGVSYPDLYDYLICNQMSPCYGWMTSNETFRNLTQDWANNLSAVYQDIMGNYTYTHFDMAMAPITMLQDAVEKWIQDGHDPAEFIEPVDGFHPSTTGNMLTSQYVWQWLETNHPSFLGGINPNNDQIQALFGDQGGY